MGVGRGRNRGERDDAVVDAGDAAGVGPGGAAEIGAGGVADADDVVAEAGDCSVEPLFLAVVGWRYEAVAR